MTVKSLRPAYWFEEKMKMKKKVRTSKGHKSFQEGQKAKERHCLISPLDSFCLAAREPGRRLKLAVATATGSKSFGAGSSYNRSRIKPSHPTAKLAENSVCLTCVRANLRAFDLCACVLVCVRACVHARERM